MDFSVNINNITINQLATNNLIANGENNQFGWSSHQKVTYGMNIVGHRNQTKSNVTTIFDGDSVDTLINDSDMMSGNWSHINDY